MNRGFVKPWETDTGVCYIPDIKFPRGFCDLAGLGLGFLIKRCVWSLGSASQVCKKDTLSSFRDNLDIPFGSTWDLGGFLSYRCLTPAVRAPMQRQLWDGVSCLEPGGRKQYLALSPQNALTLMAPKPGSAL